MSKFTKMIKPGTTKTQLVESDRVDFYRQYGWEPAVIEIRATVKPRKTAKSEPAVEEVADVTESIEEVGTDDNKGD